MKLTKLLSSRVIVGVLVTFLGLVAFNATRPPLENAHLAAFNAWYAAAAPALESASDASLASRKLTIKVRITPVSGSASTSEWVLPTQNLGNADDRQRLTRVLQLISESRVFGLSPLGESAAETPHLALSITDGDQSFDTSVALQDVQGDIRLQNLVKLLEVFSSQPLSAPVEPSRL